MNLEQLILAQSDLEDVKNRANNRRQLAAALGKRFDLDAGEVEAGLKDTKYNDCFATDNVVWFLNFGVLCWRTRLGADEYTTHGPGLHRLQKRLCKKNRRG